ncbi:trehalose-phosphatase [Sphingomonas sp.]|uniref:trehalose-phosphatase n=1 Tax=Sphingomonas sp. TaxID=28214 RepID=UPI0035C7AFF9
MHHPRNDLLPPPDLLDGAALFLDFDGTLVEIAPRPDMVSVDERLARLMARLSEKLEGRIAVISGRPVGDIAALFGAPGFAIAGSHGLEVRHADGRTAISERPPALDIVRAGLAEFAARDAALLIEDKPVGVALHYRRAPEYEAEANVLARALADRHGLRLQPGKMMVEVRSGAADKGSALTVLMREPLMASARPLFLGDDDTDEPAFVAAANLGGDGILIGPDRPTAATHRLPDVATTLDWLEHAAR